MTLKVISTFSGTGGSSCGYKLGGCEVVASVEFVPEAAESYRANFPTTKVFCRDIRTVTGKELLDAVGLEVGELDILDGSPPCASFSACGAGERLHGKVKSYSSTKQRVDDLFFEWARLVNEIKPKYIVAENVAGLDFKKYQHIRGQIINALDDYVVQYKIMNGAEYGVPQSRRRMIFIGIRRDLAAKWTGNEIDDEFFVPRLHPRESHSEFGGRTTKKWITVREALVDIQNDEAELKALEIATAKYANLKLLSEIPAPGMNHHKRFNLCRNHWDKPSATILQTNGHSGAACVCHPDGKRPHTTAELKRLMSFPDSFIVTGTYSQQHERLGRAVAPVMMKAIAERIIEIDREINNE